MKTPIPIPLLVHKARPEHPDSPAEQHCAVCRWRIRKVPGGSGVTWVHIDSGAVSAPGVDPGELPWYAVHSNLASLVHHLAYIEGWTGKEIADLVEKPWHYDTDWADYQAQTPTTEEQS